LAVGYRSEEHTTLFIRTALSHTRIDNLNCVASCDSQIRKSAQHRTTPHHTTPYFVPKRRDAPPPDLHRGVSTAPSFSSSAVAFCAYSSAAPC